MTVHMLLPLVERAIDGAVLLEVAGLQLRDDALTATGLQPKLVADNQALGHEVLVLGDTALEARAHKVDGLVERHHADERHHGRTQLCGNLVADGTDLIQTEEFTNTYSAEGAAVLKVKKELAGADWPAGGSITFTLTAPSGTPMPASCTAAAA
jgi:hypothetical protein